MLKVGRNKLNSSAYNLLFSIQIFEICFTFDSIKLFFWINQSKSSITNISKTSFNQHLQIADKMSITNISKSISIGLPNKYKGENMEEFYNSRTIKDIVYFILSIVIKICRIIRSITSRNNALISNFGGGFRCKSEYPWCIIVVKIQIFKKSVENAKICKIKNTTLSFPINRRYLNILPTTEIFKILENFLIIQILTKIRQNHEYLQIIFDPHAPNVQQSGIHIVYPSLIF
ncbi:Uncharacterized protein FWK35_00015905 [Aphis craccivora]|uniref:Uncharacterized protein n=1 Tax=Aphis craccivora TaxID=307492 RepID=A0A6G0YJ67_APHCR|nr:Uncharacterized protein FWK35_00015905 [Aphis craccivora]